MLSFTVMFLILNFLNRKPGNNKLSSLADEVLQQIHVFSVCSCSSV